MKKLMHLLFLSCRKATGLIEKRFHFKLSFMEEGQLKMHTMMCDACSHYEKQSATLEKGISALAQKDAPQTDIEALKNKISNKLDEA